MEKMKWISAKECLPPRKGDPYIRYVIWIEVSERLKETARCSDEKECKYGLLEVLVIINYLPYDEELGYIITKDMINYGTFIKYSHDGCQDDLKMSIEYTYNEFDLRENDNLRWSVDDIKKWIAIPSVCEANKD